MKHVNFMNKNASIKSYSDPRWTALRRMLPLGAAALAMLALTPLARAALSSEPELADEGHIDFTFCNRGGSWALGMVWHSNANPFDPDPAQGPVRPASSVVLVAHDQAFPVGNRSLRPDGEKWDFLGVASGEPFWWYSQTNTGGLWPGFNVCADAKAYPHPETGVIQPWKKVQLKDVRYIGKGTGKIAMWNVGALDDLSVWLSTHNGIDENDVYWIGSSDHAHPGTAFSSLGLYEVSFTLSYHPDDAEDLDTEETSPPVSYYYAVGTYWTWVAKHFRPAVWWQPGIIGENDDPDGDGIPNLLEYAYGLNPRKADVRFFADQWTLGLPVQGVSEDGGRLSLRLPARAERTNSQIRYQIEGTGDLSAATWPEQYTPSPSDLTDPPGDWQEMLLEVPVTPSTKPQWFLRNRVTLLDAIDYSSK